jgi:hypothetical protein
MLKPDSSCFNVLLAERGLSQTAAFMNTNECWKFPDTSYRTRPRCELGQLALRRRAVHWVRLVRDIGFVHNLPATNAFA